MFEIILLIVGISGIAAYARARGGVPWVWGSIALAGYIVAVYILPRVLQLPGDSDAMFVSLALGAAWLGGVALVVRFGLGHGKAKPSGMWVCPNCKMLNQHYAVVCDACQRPYGAWQEGDLRPPS